MFNVSSLSRFIIVPLIFLIPYANAASVSKQYIADMKTITLNKHQISPFEIPMRVDEDASFMRTPITQVLYQVWSIVGTGQWVNDSLETYTYTGALLTAANFYFWSAAQNNWKDAQKAALTYTDKDSVKDIDVWEWVPDSSKWLEIQKEVFTYDATQGYMTEDYIKINYRWLSGGDTSLPSGMIDWEKDKFKYNTDRQVTELLIQAVVSTDGILRDYQKQTYTYNTNKKMNDVTVQRLNTTGTMTNYLKKIYTYNTKNLLSEINTKLWAAIGVGSWVDNSKQVNTYTAFDSLDTATLKRFKSAAWVDTLRIISTYNTSNLLATNSMQQWNTSAWNYLDRYSFTYDGTVAKERLYEIYTGGNWVNAKKRVLNPGLGVKKDNKKSGSTLLENITTLLNGSIRLVLKEPAFISATVYDVKGNSVVTLVNNRMAPKGMNTLYWNKKDVAGNPVASGLYFLQLRINNSTINKEMLLVK